MKPFILLAFFSIFLTPMAASSNEAKELIDVCQCPGLEDFADDIYSVLNVQYRATQRAPKEQAVKIDSLKLLLSVQRDARGQFQCQEHTSDYFNSDTAKMGILRSGSMELGVKSSQYNISNIRPEIVHLSKEGTRELYFMGKANGKDVYFYMQIHADGTTTINYLPIKPVDVVEPRFALQSNARLKKQSPQQIALSGEAKPAEVDSASFKLVDNEIDQTVMAIQTSDTKTNTKVYFHDPDRNSVYTFSGDVLTMPGEQAQAGMMGMQYDFKGEETKLSFGSKVDPNAEELTPHLQGQVTQKIAPKVEATVKGQSIGQEDLKTQSGLKIGDEALQLRLSTNTHNDQITQKQAIVGGKQGIYSGEVGITSTNSGETVRAKAGVQITPAVQVRGNVVDAPTYNQVGLGAEYKGTFESGNKYRIGCDANLRVQESRNYTFNPTLSYKTHAGKDDNHVISCETTPVINQDGLQEIKLKAQYDYRVSDTTTVGVFVQSRADVRTPNSTFNTAAGVQAKIQFGSNRIIRKLKVRKLVESKMETRHGNKSLVGYYETTTYTCDVKKQKLKIEKPSKGGFFSFLGGGKKDLYKVAVAPTSKLEKVLYSPDDKRPETFCKFPDS